MSNSRWGGSVPARKRAIPHRRILPQRRTCLRLQSLPRQILPMAEAMRMRRRPQMCWGMDSRESRGGGSVSARKRVLPQRQSLPTLLLRRSLPQQDKSPQRITAEELPRREGRGDGVSRRGGSDPVCEWTIPQRLGAGALPANHPPAPKLPRPPTAMDALPLSQRKEESCLDLWRGGGGGRPADPAGEQRRPEERSCGDGYLQLESRAVGFLRQSFTEDRRGHQATEGSNGRAASIGRCTEDDRKGWRER